MDTHVIVLDEPGRIEMRRLPIAPAGASDILVDVRWSGVSAGTEKLLWTGRMPPFPGLSYPLVPGYEAVGQVIDAGADARARIGETVFVPGANCFEGARGLFGAQAARLVVPAARAVALPETLGADGALIALAATAHHALAGGPAPNLIIGHGALGRLLARIAIALGGAAPIIWDTSSNRRDGADGYEVVHPDADHRTDYAAIIDASGADGILDALMPRLARGGEIVLAGFYDRPVAFAYPPAFLKEARIRIAAEFTPTDTAAVIALVTAGRLSLAGIVSHTASAADAPAAYAQAFDDPACLKMVFDWSQVQ